MVWGSVAPVLSLPSAWLGREHPRRYLLLWGCDDVPRGVPVASSDLAKAQVYSALAMPSKLVPVSEFGADLIGGIIVVDHLLYKCRRVWWTCCTTRVSCHALLGSGSLSTFIARATLMGKASASMIKNDKTCLTVRGKIKTSSDSNTPLHINQQVRFGMRFFGTKADRSIRRLGPGCSRLYLQYDILLGQDILSSYTRHSHALISQKLGRRVIGELGNLGSQRSPRCRRLSLR